MRCLWRNKVTFYYALYTGMVPIIDENNNFTGDYDVQYSKPEMYEANISAAKGETDARQFGENLSYDKVITMDDSAPDIDEYSILWVDRMPDLDTEGQLVLDESEEVVTPYDYKIVKVAKSLNSVQLAIKKVDVSG